MKIIPTKKCYQALFNYIKSGDSYQRISSNGDYPEPSQYKSVNYDLPGIIADLLIKYGYNLDLEDIYLATHNRITLSIQNTPFFALLDAKFMDYCITNNYFPYKLANIALTIESLEKACDVYGSYATIKKMISEGIQPNITCLRNACKIKNNLTVIKLLIESGVQPDLVCIANIANWLGNRTLSWTVSAWQDNEFAKSRLSADKAVPILMEQIPGSAINQTEAKEVEAQVEVKEAEVKDEYTNNIISNKKKSLVLVPNKEPSPVPSPSSSSSSSQELNIISFKDTDKDLPDLAELVNDPFKTYNLSKKSDLGKLLLKKSEKTEQYRYIDIKKMILTFIKKHELLISQDNKMLIKFNKDLAQVANMANILGANSGTLYYFHFNDLDGFIAKCIQTNKL